MKYLLALAVMVGCALGAPAPAAEPGPQFQQGRYNAFDRYPYNRYNYNRYNPYYNNGRYRPQFYSTPAPFATTASTPVAATVSGAEPEALPPAVASAAASYADGKLYHVSDDRNAQILRLDNDATPEGGFHYSYETSNGIAAEASGSPRNLGGVPPNVPTVVQGSFSWVSPEGRVISISYVADENGYRAVGDAIPTPPPIPEAILRSIEYNRQFAANEPAK